MDAPHRDSTRFLVLRHGQSEWNAQHRWQGHADVALDETGIAQARAAAQALGQFDAIWSSDLQRARLTAEIIAEHLGVGPVAVDPRLRETHVGPWEGLTHRDVEEQYPGYLAARRRPEGFEPYDDAAARMVAALVDIAAEHPGGEILVVSHGGVIRAVRRSLGAPDERLANLAGSRFALDPRHGLVAGELVPSLVGGVFQGAL